MAAATAPTVRVGGMLLSAEGLGRLEANRLRCGCYTGPRQRAGCVRWPSRFPTAERGAAFLQSIDAANIPAYRDELTFERRALAACHRRPSI